MSLSNSLEVVLWEEKRAQKRAQKRRKRKDDRIKWG